MRRFFERYPIPKGSICYDPCAARGSLITEASSPRPDLRWGANELDPACMSDLLKIVPNATNKNFLTIGHSAEPFPATIVSNPPYSLAEEFIEHGAKIAKIGAWLLRLNFFGGGRNAFHRRHNPGVFISPNRPSFNGWGSDACEYGWFVYGDPAVAGKIFYLDETSAEEIAAWNETARKMYPEDDPKLKKRRKEIEASFDEPLSSAEIRAILSGTLTHAQVRARREEAKVVALAKAVA